MTNHDANFPCPLGKADKKPLESGQKRTENNIGNEKQHPQSPLPNDDTHCPHMFHACFPEWWGSMGVSIMKTC